jgi:hypothetical protein
VYLANSVPDHQVPLQRLTELRQNFAILRIPEWTLRVLVRISLDFPGLLRQAAVSALFADTQLAVWRIERRR